MSKAEEIVVTFPGGRRVDARVDGHLLHTDQPRESGGEDSAASPFQLFLASIGACAGIFVQGFCAARGISPAGLAIIERPEIDADGTLRSVSLELQLPEGFPMKYRNAIMKVVEQCSVKRAIAAQPIFKISTSPS